MSMVLSMGNLIQVAFIVFLAGCNQQDPTANRSPIDAAENAYFQFDLEKATLLLRQVKDDIESTPQDREKACHQLARIAAFIHNDIDGARTLLKTAIAIGDNDVGTLTKLAQIEREFGNFDLAIQAANDALSSAETTLQRQGANLEYARAELTNAVRIILDGDSDAIDRGRLQIAFDRVQAILKEQPGLTIPSYVALELALILQNGPAAYQAWQSYFHIRDNTGTTSVLKEPSAVLERVLNSWRDRTLSETERIEVIRALAASRMFEAATMIVLIDIPHKENDDPRTNEIVAYYKYLAQVRQTTHAFYQTAAIGRGDKNEKKFVDTLGKHANSLWSQLDWPESTPEFSKKKFQDEIGKRFGTEMTFKRISGFYGLHLGHRVVDEKYVVEQYGKKADLRFIGLDFMASNGFTSWFWDGRAQVGGWAANPTIIQIRSAYADGGIDAWIEVSDPAKREEIEKEITKYEVSDVELAREQPYAYLPGLAKRIKHNSLLKLLRELRGEGLTGPELRLAFIADVEQAILESSIVAHEGRHAIDATQTGHFLRSSEEKEFRAKLSEIAFASDPFLAIVGGILSKNIGDGSAHGEANERVMTGIINWMDQNRKAINGLDPDLPLMPQLDRLTNEQLKEAARSLDPMAAGR